MALAPIPDADRITAAQEAIRQAADKPGFGKLVAIDPYGCGCTECLVGEYKPLDYATDEELIAMILGELANHTGYEITAFHVLDSGMVLKPREIQES
jgi:hypothetical protein